MQQATRGKLCRATGNERRETIMSIYNGTATAAALLEETWANVTPLEAMDVLGSPDVTVTNQSDKTMQIERLKVRLCGRGGEAEPPRRHRAGLGHRARGGRQAGGWHVARRVGGGMDGAESAE